MRVLYYMEKELANFDPSRPGPPSSRVERGEEPWSVKCCRGGGWDMSPGLPVPRMLAGKPWTLYLLPYPGQ